MAFRELRDFTEIMRALGYPRIISVENFRTPNFALVADVLFWMVQRYDPLVHLSDNIESEDDRVEFLTSVAQIVASKARVTLKTRALYAADGHAVKELLKLARTLYKAQKASEEPVTAEEEDDEAFTLTGNLADLKSSRAAAAEITERGAKLFDLLVREPELRKVRLKALRFLDAVANNLDSRAEQAHIERSIRDLVASAKENVRTLEKQCADLVADQKTLDGKIKKRGAELERNEKRLKSLHSVRPAFMDEYEKLERELAEEYEVYLERFRNLDFLEHELDLFEQAEKGKLEASERALKKLQKKLREEELKMFIGEDGSPEAVPNRRPGAAQPGSQGGGAAAGGGGVMQGSMMTNSSSGSEESGSEESDDDGSGDGSEEESGSGLIDDDDEEGPEEDEDDSDLGSESSGGNSFSGSDDEGF